MEQRAQADDFDFVRREIERPRNGHRQDADALGMARRVRIARVERGRQRANRSRVSSLRLFLGVGDRRHQRVEGFCERVELAA